MNRIGIAASKIAKGNIFVFNVCVVFFVFLLSFLVFIVAGLVIMLALIVLGYVVNGFLPQDLLTEWKSIVAVCMATLTAVVCFFAIVALIQNIKFKLPGE
ncbi:MAG: hypothetical protein AB1650_00525 [Candidatus Omnitrophota bacterium]